MGRNGGFDYHQIKTLRDNLSKLENEEAAFMESCAKELAARLLALAIRRTPKDTGALKRGWTTQQSGSGADDLKTGSAKQYADTMKVHHYGDTYVIEVINPIEHASYVEYGHRTRDHQGWVPGKFMMTISEKEIQAAAPRILEKKLNKWLEGCMNGK